MDAPAGWFPMPSPTALAMYTEMRGMAYCSAKISVEECAAVIMDDPWHDWNYADLMYARTTAVFLFVGIATFALGNLALLGRQRGHGVWLATDPMYIWVAGLVRYVNSRQYRLARSWYSLSLGQILVISGLVLFFSGGLFATTLIIMTLAPKPYYWPNPYDFGSSPPLATRTGYMAIAILPFQVILATKWNLITCLTGVSHEKLQVYHRWLGWMMFVLSLIHTFPFIVVDIHAGTMAEKMATDWYTVSGIICLVPLAVLVSAFIGPVRRRFYEISKIFHFVIAAFFVVMLFLHCGFTMTSAYYFVALAAAYSSSWLIRLFIVLKNGLHRADLRAGDDLVAISIPTRLHWKPGQYFFLRFITKDLHMLTSHPFTAASTPDGHLDFLVKRRGGMTARLATYAEGRPRVVIDGPYGGLGMDFGTFDRVLLMAAGSGLSFVLGVASELARRDCAVTVVYVSRSNGAYSLAPLILDCSLQAMVAGCTVFSHVSTMSHIDEKLERDAEAIEGEALLATPALLPGRPDLAEHVRNATRHIGTVGIAICGPEEFMYDARTAVAAEQLRIVKGDIDCTECYLHSEVFSWIKEIATVEMLQGKAEAAIQSRVPSPQPEASVPTEDTDRALQVFFDNFWGSMAMPGLYGGNLGAFDVNSGDDMWNNFNALLGTGNALG